MFNATATLLKIRNVPAGSFRSNVLTLMTGTAIAQAIPIAISPILTRIYTPNDFGVFAIYSAITAIIGVMATGRYELAIMLPKKESDAVNIAILSALVATLISFITFIVVYTFNTRITKMLSNPEVSNWLYLMPLSILMMGVYQSLNYWNNRKKQFNRLALSRVLQSSGTAVTQLGLGYGTGLSGGLIVGSICGLGASIATLTKMNWAEDRVLQKEIKKASMLANARLYKKFPMVSAWGSLFDSSAQQMPIFIITNFFGVAITGLFSMTFKVLNMPMTLISGAISQVLFQKVATLHNKQSELLYNYILKIFFLLLAITIPFLIVIGFFGVEIFTFVFGQSWAQAGKFAALISVAVAVRFAVSPLSTVLALDHNVTKGVRWQAIYFFTLTVTLLATCRLKIETFLLVFVGHEVILYGLYLYIILAAAKESSQALPGDV